MALYSQLLTVAFVFLLKSLPFTDCTYERFWISDFNENTLSGTDELIYFEKQ